MSNCLVHEFRDLYKKYSFNDNAFLFKPIWHYTSVNGLTGIIQDNKSEHSKLHFWFTRSDCLNDTSEGSNVLELFQKSCLDLLNQGDISCEFYNHIKTCEIPTHQLINYPLPTKDDGVHTSMLDCVPCNAYICSFSLKEDSLDMWRYYAKDNGGYGLKLNPYIFDCYKEYEYSEYDEKALFVKICSFKVIYDDCEKIKLLKQIISDTFLAYQNANTSESEKTDNAIYFLQFVLNNFQYQFKHHCFASEEEYRFVVYLPNSKPKELKNELPIIRYRTQDGMVIPYIDLVVENGSIYLADVLISPYIKNKTALTTTNDYLKHCGFSCVARRSQLPVRK